MEVDDIQQFFRTANIQNDPAIKKLKLGGYTHFLHLVQAPPMASDLSKYGFVAGEVEKFQALLNAVLKVLHENQKAGPPKKPTSLADAPLTGSGAGGGEKLKASGGRALEKRRTLMRSLSIESTDSTDLNKKSTKRRLSRMDSSESIFSSQYKPLEMESIPEPEDLPRDLTPSKKLLFVKKGGNERRNSLALTRTLLESFPEPEAEPEYLKVEEWFCNITGCPESEFRKERGNLIKKTEQGYVIFNKKSNSYYLAGEIQLIPFAHLINKQMLNPKNKKKEQKILTTKGLGATGNVEYVELVIITRKRDDDPKAIKYVDVAYLQSLRENRDAVFQVASNFNGVEAQSEIVKPDAPGFTEKYYADRTQGPAASISAGAGAILRVHGAFIDSHKNNPELWSQSGDKQINFLEKLGDYYPIRNGYVMFTGDESKFPKFQTNFQEYKKKLLSTLVCYHKNQQVVTGHRNGALLEKCTDPQQKVDQVMCAAVNIFQGKSGSTNAHQVNIEDKCQLVLDMAYQGTYLCALNNGRKKIFLTLVGGGIFGNKKEWIYDAIIRAHKMWGVKGKSSLEKVYLVVFNPKDIEKLFIDKATAAKIPIIREEKEGPPETD